VGHYQLPVESLYVQLYLAAAACRVLNNVFNSSSGAGRRAKS
jgi:hypothetical protein